MFRVIQLTATGDKARRVLTSARAVGAALVIGMAAASALPASAGAAENAGYGGAARPVMADEFSGQAAFQNGAAAALNQQAMNAQLSDPTAPDSIRSHGRP